MDKDSEWYPLCSNNDILLEHLEDSNNFKITFDVLEKYENNVDYATKKEMNEKFYKPLFEKTYDNLKHGGHYILNINKEIYESVCVPLFGHAFVAFSLKKSKIQNDYTEYVYVWRKQNL
jgi:hypothetical protein